MHVRRAHATDGGDLLGDGLTLILRFDAVHDDIGTGARQGLGNREPDALRGPRDQSGTTIQHVVDDGRRGPVGAMRSDVAREIGWYPACC